MNKITKFVLGFILVFASIFGFACTKNKEDDGGDDPVIPKLQIEKTGYELMAGKSERIGYSFIDSDQELEVVFETSNADVAVVENEKIKAIGKGTTTVKAYLKDYPDVKIELTVKVNELPVVTITAEGDKDEVYTNHKLQLSASISDNSTTSVIWESTDNTLATIDSNGLLTGHVSGTVVINATMGEYKGSFVVKVVKEPKLFVLDFKGGISKELYLASDANAVLNVNSYAGDFWSSYTQNVFIYTKSGDPGPTFSDRIYIGKNTETGFYEVKKILLSGGTSWPSDGEYVITISNSYSGFATIHKEVEKVKVGDVVIFDGEIKKITASKPLKFSFYDANGGKGTLEYSNAADITLPTPIKEGNRFLGWVDEEGNPVTTTPSTITGLTIVYANWYEIDPVTALTVAAFDTEIETGTKFTISATISPTNAYFKKVLYSTSNKDIVSINDKGELVAVNAGTAKITVRDYVGKFIYEYDMVVNMKPSIDITFPSSFSGVLKVNDTIQFEPVLIGKATGDITYASSDATVASVDASGLVKGLKEGTAEITITAGTYTLKVGITVNNLNTENDVDKVLKLIADNNFAVVDAGNACLYNDGRERYYAPTYGSVNRYLFTDLTINTKYTNTAANNSNGHINRRTDASHNDTIEFVCVHDTATLTGTSESIASYMASGDVSIHYTVGNDLVWQVVPEEYIAFHAGDGTGTTFSWKDTGVAATEGVAPVFAIAPKGSGFIYTCNGQETSIPVPSTGTTPTSTSLLTYLGPTWKIENGKYYMGLTWWSSSYGKISSHGGNNNSIGIEMNVNTSNDMYDTYQRTAKLVANICIRNGLDTTRVKMHNTFSGKNCAQVILAGEFWNRFMEMVNLEYELQSKYKDVKIAFKSNDPTIIGDDGRVIKAPEITTTVSYDVTVSLGSTTKTITLYSVVPGTTTWEQWQGTYLVTDIWNNGHFCICDKE